jgi:hypothetical protein
VNTWETGLQLDLGREHHFDDDFDTMEFYEYIIEYFEKYFDSIFVKKERYKKVGRAILTVLKNRHSDASTDMNTKKGFFVELRRLSGLTTEQMFRPLFTARMHYNKLKNSYTNGDIIKEPFEVGDQLYWNVRAKHKEEKKRNVSLRNASTNVTVKKGGVF